jgi:hypothetical protein
VACGPRDVYNELIKQGFSTNQAIGALANGMAESGLNAETRVIDSNGYYSNGIWQFNEASYPNSGSLVTGKCAADISAQVGLLRASVSGQALAGGSGAQVAGNFAQYFERCATCQQGGASYQQRVGNAATVSGWISSGKWPTSSAGLTGSAAASSAQAAGPDCAFTLGGGKLGPIGLPSACLLKKATIRHAAGAGLMLAGGTVGMVGIILLAAFAFRASGAARTASAALGMVPTPGAQAASRAIASPQAAARARVGRQQQAAATQRRAGEQAAARQRRQGEQAAARQRRQGEQAAARQRRQAEAATRNPKRSPPPTGTRQLRPIRKRPPNYRPPAEPGAVPGEFHHDD